MSFSAFQSLAGALLLATAALAQAADAPSAALPSVFEHAALTEQLQKMLGPAAGTLKSAAAVHGAFTQKKFLKELPQPLVSSGEFVVARGLGVDWHTRKPFDATVVLTPQALIQRGADGSAKRVSADQQPGLRAVGEIFDALFTLDLAKLGETFQLYGEPGVQGAWTLGLVPREPAFAKVMNRILITGSTQPARIVMFEGGGDRTEIELGAVNAQRELAEADRKRFAP
ncbi:MAG: hypothetical protein NVS9B10_21330 [Nevskia sp.]